MTEDHPQYAPPDPGPAELTYRVTDPTHSCCFDMRFPPGPIADELASDVARIVVDAVRRGSPAAHLPTAPPPVFEVLSQATLDRLEALETALRDCRNAMLDVAEVAVPDEARWCTLIDAATDALGDCDTYYR